MLNLIETVARDAGKKLIPYFDQHIQARQKTSHQNLVSEADENSQQYIQSELMKGMNKLGFSPKDVGFLGEEGLDVKGKYTFIIDPLDGTSNFISGIPYFAVSIACVIDGKLVYGCTYNPISNVLYRTESGQGAYKIEAGRSTRLNVEAAELKDSNLNTYYSSDPEIRAELFKITEKLSPLFRGIRIWGSGTLELAQCTENLANVVIYGKCGVWDVAVAKLLIEESNGILIDWEGNSIEIDLDHHDKPYQVLACHPSHIDTLVSSIKNALR